MNVSNLQKTYSLLLDYLQDNGYCRWYINGIRRGIKLVLDTGSKQGVVSYEQLYLIEMQRRGYKETSQACNRLKSNLGIVSRFDLEGIYPQRGVRPGFMSPPKPYDLLVSEYKSVVNHYEQTAVSVGKASRTVYVERQAGILFFMYLQKAGASSMSSITERQVYDFFFDGEEIIRGKAYKDKISSMLKASIVQSEPVKQLRSLLPSIPKRYSNYPYLTRSESEKLRICLEAEKSQLTLLDKAIATLAYYTGLRGTDILSLTPANIDWVKEEIRLVQSKTGVELTLPMNAPVGNAIWEYLVSERPQSAEKVIFVNSTKPYGKIFGTWVHLKKLFNAAGVRTNNERTGVRLFRHHLVTTLLGNNVPTPVISSILGHTSPESLNPYVDADLEHLRECSLSIEDYPVAKEVFES